LQFQAWRIPWAGTIAPRACGLLLYNSSSIRRAETLIRGQRDKVIAAGFLDEGTRYSPILLAGRPRHDLRYGKA
jgi:hypothetical protein